MIVLLMIVLLELFQSADIGNAGIAETPVSLSEIMS